MVSTIAQIDIMPTWKRVSAMKFRHYIYSLRLVYMRQLTGLTLCNSLMPNKRQAITWTIDDAMQSAPFGKKRQCHLDVCRMLIYE